MEDYIAALVTGGQHAVTASFGLPSLIEQGLGMALQNRMLFKCIMQLNDLTEKEKKVIEPFLHNDEALFLPEYLELLKKFFLELNIRNCIMRGLPDFRTKAMSYYYTGRKAQSIRYDTPINF